MNQPIAPRPYNPETLFAELRTSGLPIESVDADGNTTYKHALTESETSLARQVLNNHSPEEPPPSLSTELINAGITLEIRLEALWKAVIEQDDNAAAALQQIISDITARQAHEAD